MIAMEIRCRALSRTELEGELAHIHKFFAERSMDQLLVAFGYGCNVTNDQIYEELRVNLCDLRSFVGESESQDRFHLGAGDLFIQDLTKEHAFVLCHESDVHFHAADGDDNGIQSRWEAMGYAPYVVMKK